MFLKKYLFILLLSSPAWGQQSPQFEAQLLDSNVQIGYGLAIGDVDGDKKPDILLADKKQFVWYRNGDWKNYDTVLEKSGLTHEQILDGFQYDGLKGYARPRPYPRLYNIVVQNNFYLKRAAVWLRQTPG